MEIGIINVNISELTQREQQVLAMIGRGYSIPKIAEKLFRSQKTIETHRQSLGRKLGASNRVELARIAIQVGLAPLEIDAANGGSSFVSSSVSQNGESAEGGQEHQALRRVESACVSVVDVAYARALCETLCEAIGVTGVGLFSSEENLTTLRSVALRYRGQWVTEATLRLADTPCAETIRSGFFRCDGRLDEVCPAFTSDTLLGVRGYMGIRLDDPVTQEPLGTLTALLDRDDSIPDVAELVMRSCAVRAAAELSRMRLTDRLQRSVEALEERLALYEPREVDNEEGLMAEVVKD